MANPYHQPALDELQRFIKRMFEVERDEKDPVQLPIVDVQDARFTFQQIATELHVDIGDLIVTFNNFFAYKLYDPKSVIPDKWFQSTLHTLLYNLRQLKNLQSDDELNCILRYYVYKKHGHIRSLDKERKLSFLDFNQLILRALPRETLIEILNDEVLYYGKEIAQELVDKTIRQDKHYIIDAYDRVSVPEIKTWLLEEQTNITQPVSEAERQDKLSREHDSSVDTSVAFEEYTSSLKIRKELDKLSTLVTNTKAQQEVSKCVQAFWDRVQEEEEVIEWLLRVNVALGFDPKNMNPAKAFPLLDQLPKQSLRQHCLIWQVLHNSITSNNRIFPEVFHQFAGTVQQQLHLRECGKFLSPSDFCSHDSFHYYTYRKWLVVFDRILTHLHHPKDFTSALNRQVAVLSPRDAFCSPCYEQYKSLQVSMIHPRRDAKIPHELLALMIANRNRVSKYRQKFADACDIAGEGKRNHFEEYFTSRQATFGVLEELLRSLQREQERLLNVKQKQLQFHALKEERKLNNF